jgi:L-aspartate oxidase
MLDPAIVRPLQELMSSRAGVLRSGAGLTEAVAGLAALGEQADDKPGADAWQATNLHLVASAIAAAALAREETRGSHWREDFPESSDAWRGHLIMSLAPAGLAAVFEPDLHV